MLVTQNSKTSRLSSKVVTSLEGQVTPPRDETPGKVAMGEDHDVGIVSFFWVLDRVLSLFVESADFGDDAVDSRGHLCGRFSGGLTGRAAVVPDAPVRPFLLDILGKHSFVRSIVPFSNVGVGNNVTHWGLVFAKEKFGSSLSSLTGGDEYVSEVSRVDEFSLPNHPRTHFKNHLLTVGGEWKVSDSSVSTVQRPLGLAVADEIDSGHSLWGHFINLDLSLRLKERRL